MRRAGLCLCALVCACSGLQASAVYITPQATISVETGVIWGAPLNTSISAQFSGPWAQGLRWKDRSTIIRVDLPMTFNLTGIVLQGRDVEWLEIDYLYQGSWTPLWEAGDAVAGLRGLSAAETVRWVVLAGTPAESLRIYASGREGFVRGEMYSLTGVHLWGNQMFTEAPEPPVWWTALAGLALLAVRGRLSLSRT